MTVVAKKRTSCSWASDRGNAKRQQHGFPGAPWISQHGEARLEGTLPTRGFVTCMVACRCFQPTRISRNFVICNYSIARSSLLQVKCPASLALVFWLQKRFEKRDQALPLNSATQSWNPLRWGVCDSDCSCWWSESSEIDGGFFRQEPTHQTRGQPDAARKAGPEVGVCYTYGGLNSRRICMRLMQGCNGIRHSICLVLATVCVDWLIRWNTCVHS